MSEFKPDPVLTLESMEDVRKWLDNPVGWSRVIDGKMDKWRIKSPWIIGLIDEIESSGQYPYNAEVKWLAEERLGIPSGRVKRDSREGTPLSLLVYNAQCYRRSDKLKAMGFVAGDEFILQRAYQSGCKIETCNHTLLTVKKINDTLYAMPPRKRKWAVNIAGVPVRLVT